MQHTRILTDALREIRRTLGRFLSLFLLSALAVAFLAGLRTTAPDMEASADAYYDAQRLMDIHILSTLGLTGDDIDLLSRQSGIGWAEGAYTVDAIVHAPEDDKIVKVLSLTNGVNLPRLVSGRLPAAPDECLVEPDLLDALHLSLGERLTLDTGTGAFENALRQSSFTIVGTADSPLYISIERGSSSLGTGRVSAFVLLPAGAFDLDAYTDAYLLAKGTRALSCYSDAYTERMDALLDALEPLGDHRAALRHDEVIYDALGELALAQTAYDEAEAEADRALSEVWATLQKARTQLDDGWKAWRDGETSYQDQTGEAEEKLGRAERVDLPAALAQLEQGEAEYTAGARTLAEGQAAYDSGLDAYRQGLADYDAGLSNLTEQQAVYDAAEAELQTGEADYAAGLAALQSARAKLESGAEQLKEGEQKIRDSEAQLSYGESAYRAGAAALGEGWKTYKAAKSGFDFQQSYYEDILIPLLNAPDEAISHINTPDKANTFYTIKLLPLRDSLTAVRDSLSPEDRNLVDSILRVLPDDGVKLWEGLRSSPAQYPSGLIQALTGGAQVLQPVLEAAKAALAQSYDRLTASAAELERTRAQLDTGRADYEAGQAALETSRQDYRSGLSALSDSERQLRDARSQLDDGWAQLQSGKAALDDGWAQLNASSAQLGAAKSTLDASLSELEAGRAQLAASRQTLDEGWSEYRGGLADLARGRSELEAESADAAKTLKKSEDELEEGEAAYADGLQSYWDAQGDANRELSDARQKLNDARREVRDIEDCKWYVLGRNTNVGYVSFQQDAQRMGNIADLFPVIFFLVAALVCLTTMTRMVEEQRVQIGGMKALGYDKWTISVKYVGYGLVSSLLGGLFGLVLGCTLIPWVIYNAWTILYTLGDLIIPLSPSISLLSVGAAVVTVAGAAVLTCWSTLSEVPAQLMRPRAPKVGKRVLLERIGPLWRRLSFTHKVTARNLFRYKRRFFMTVAGIGGCTALIVTGFGLRDSIFDIMNKQYDEIYSYQSQVGLVDDLTPDELMEIEAALNGDPNVTDYMLSHQTSLSVESGKRAVEGYVVAVSDRTRFSSFIHLRHRLDHAPVSLPDDGAVLTEKLADLLGVKVGDTVTLAGDERAEVRVAGITENYIFHYVYLSDVYYRQVYGESPENNMVLCSYTQASRAISDEVAQRLIPLAGVTSVSYIPDTRRTFQNSMESVDYAVLVVNISAAALAFVVLFNLTNINITERLRELATLKVLGFFDRELRAYVYRENAVLTALGILAGLVMGKLLHGWLILTVEIDMLMFGRSAKPMSYLYAVLLTILFSLLVNLAAGRKLKKIDMVESLKTVE